MTAVLDASALLAYLQQESGAQRVRPLFPAAVISAVNWTEVVQKVAAGTQGAIGLRATLEHLGISFVPFTLVQADIAGALYPRTRNLGLSLGDRACLALGLDLRATVYTADRSWEQLKLDVEITVIR